MYVFEGWRTQIFQFLVAQMTTESVNVITGLGQYINMTCLSQPFIILVCRQSEQHADHFRSLGVLTCLCVLKHDKNVAVLEVQTFFALVPHSWRTYARWREGQGSLVSAKVPSLTHRWHPMKPSTYASAVGHVLFSLRSAEESTRDPTAAFRN